MSSLPVQELIHFDKEKGIGVQPTIADNVHVNGIVDCIHKITIEKDVFFGHDVMLITGSHDYNKFGEDRKKQGGGGPITIREGAWIATRALICGPCEIGKHAVVGAGSVLIGKNVPEYQLWGGNPCRFIKIIPH